MIPKLNDEYVIRGAFERINFELVKYKAFTRILALVRDFVSQNHTLVQDSFIFNALVMELLYF